MKSTAAHAHAIATVTKRLHAEHDNDDDVLTGSRSVFDTASVIMGVYGMYGMYGPHVENVICATSASTSASALAFADGV